MSEPTALELADRLEDVTCYADRLNANEAALGVMRDATAMLRSQHAEIARLTALVEAQDEAIVLLLANRGWCVGDKAKTVLDRIAKLKGGE